jgi:hypothetical protein
MALTPLGVGKQWPQPMLDSSPTGLPLLGTQASIWGKSMRYLALMVTSAALLATSAEGQLVRSGTGIGATAARDAFREDLGGGTVAGANGSFGGQRREINWDGVPDSQAAPNLLAPNFFNVSSPRGVVFNTPGIGFEVSANAGLIAPVNFGDINPAYPGLFAPFSAQRLFTPIGSNIMDVNFLLPGTNTTALTRGFGAFFSDVDLANTTSIQLFGLGNVSLGTFFAQNVPGANQTLSFLGISFADPTIARVRITTGNAALSVGTNETSTTDLVVMDDFLFGEPTLSAVPEPSAWALMIFGFSLAGAMLRRRRVVPALA